MMGVLPKMAMVMSFSRALAVCKVPFIGGSGDSVLSLDSVGHAPFLCSQLQAVDYQTAISVAVLLTVGVDVGLQIG